MVLIENEGALFRGPTRSTPKEVWSPRLKAWKPYTDLKPKPIEWGNEIDQAEANRMMGVSAL